MGNLRPLILPPPLKSARLAIIFITIVAGGICRADTNAWIKGASGVWEETNSWSLGVLPDSSQSIRIDGSWLAVAINPATRQQYPQSLTVNDVYLDGSNTVLLLNWFGTNTPLTVSNGVTVAGTDSTNHATLMCLESGLSIENGPFWVTGNGQVVEDGGFLRVNNGSTFLNGYFYLTNGLFEAASVAFGFDPSGYSNENGYFYQYGGRVNLTNLSLGSYSLANGLLTVAGQESIGTSLYDGHQTQYTAGRLVQSGGTNAGSIRIAVLGEYDLIGGHFEGSINCAGAFKQSAGMCNSSGVTISIPSGASDPGGADNGFVQTGGTNLSGSVQLLGGIYGGPNRGVYTLSNGTLLVSGQVSLGPECNFSQSGGTHTNAGIELNGVERLGSASAYFSLSGGTLATTEVDIWGGAFSQENGTAEADMILVSGYDCRFSLSGGVLSDRNALVYYVERGGFFQSGGIHIVSNLLAISDPAAYWSASPGYVLSGGELRVNNLQVDQLGAFHHTGGSLTQTGILTMAGGIWDEQTTAQTFGPLQLSEIYGSTNSTLFLPAGSCVLHFADSSGLLWTNTAILSITNWNGSVRGGGLHQVFFGGNPAGLTSLQLGRIRFVNPAGLAPSNYLARILADGEVVPVPRHAIAYSMVGTNLVLNWPGGVNLQTATNVNGPYEDLPELPPYTNTLPPSPQRFFRLRYY